MPPTATSSGTGSRSSTVTGTVTATATGSATPAPSTSIRLSLRFIAPVHEAMAATVSAQSGEVGPAHDAFPVTVASAALPLPALRVSLAQGCVGASEAFLGCSITAPLLASRSSLKIVPVEASAVAAAAAPPLRLAPSAAVRFLPPRGGACIPVNVDFVVLPHRQWPATASLDPSDTCEPVAKFALPAANQNASLLGSSAAIKVPLAAASAYAQSAASLHAVRCELRAEEATVDGTDGGSSAGRSSDPVIAVAHAAILAVESAIPVPLDIMLLRRSTGLLLSLRSGAVERVRLEDARLYVDGSSHSETPVQQDSQLSRCNVLPLTESLIEASIAGDISALGVSDAEKAAGNATAIAVAHAMAAAAARLLYSATDPPSRPASTLSSSSHSAPVTGSTIMVIVLDTRAGLARPSLEDARVLSSRYSAASAEAQRMNLSNSACGSNSSAGRDDRGCSAEGRADAVALLASASSRQRLVVTVGGVRCRVVWVSPDGSQVHVETPSFSRLCSTDRSSLDAGAAAASSQAASHSCGYQAISLFYEQEVDDDQSMQDNAPRDSSGSRRLTNVSRHRVLGATSGIPPAATNASSRWPWLASWLMNGPSLMTASGSESAAAADQLKSLVASAAETPLLRSVSCPPWCPSNVLAEALPLAVAGAGSAGAVADAFQEVAWLGTLAPALLSADGTGVPVVVSSDDWAGEGAGSQSGQGDSSAAALLLGGLFYTADCAAAGYTPVESGACANVSDPAHRRCAFVDAGGECSPCPANALCPGGRRAIPYRGFYATSESSGVIKPCAAPAEARCIGWDDSLGAVRCGEPYKQLSLGCSACASGWFPQSDGTCSACPAGSGLGALARALLAFTGAALAVGAIVLGITALLARLLGGAVQGGFSRALDLLVWSVILLQVLAQVGRTAAPGLPPFIQGLFRTLAALQLEDVGLPSACWRMYPFTAEVLQMTAAIGFSGVLLICLVCDAPLCRRVLRRRAVKRRHASTEQRRSSCCCCVARSTGSSTVCSSSSRRVQHVTALSIARRRLVNGAKAACGRVRRICTLDAAASWLPVLSFTAASLLYSLLANTVFKLLHCETMTLSLGAYLSLDRDNAAGETTELLTRAASDSSLRATHFTVSVLVSNASHMCYSGAHAPAAAIAWVCLATYLIGYPIGTIMLLRARARHVLRWSFSGFKGLSGTAREPLPPCLYIGFEGAGALAAVRAQVVARSLRDHRDADSEADNVGATGAGTPAGGSNSIVNTLKLSSSAPVGQRGSAAADAEVAGIPPGLAHASGLIATDGGAARSALSRHPCTMRLLWLCCGRERALRSYAYASESSAARVARLVQLRKLHMLLQGGTADKQMVKSTAAGDAARTASRGGAVTDSRASECDVLNTASAPRRLQRSRRALAAARVLFGSAALPSIFASRDDDDAREESKDVAQVLAVDTAEVLYSDGCGKSPPAVSAISDASAAGRVTAPTRGTGRGRPSAGSGDAAKRTSSTIVLPTPLIAGNLEAAALDCSDAVAADPWLSHWTGATYRGSAYTARHADFALFASLAAVQVFWPRPETRSEAIVRGAVNVVLLLLCAWWIVTRSPFKRSEPWKLWIKTGSLLLAALAAVLTHVTLVANADASSSYGDFGDGGRSASVSGTAGGAAEQKTGTSSSVPSAEAAQLQQRLSIAIFAGCVLLVGVLAFAFAASNIRGTAGGAPPGCFAAALHHKLLRRRNMEGAAGAAAQAAAERKAVDADPFAGGAPSVGGERYSRSSVLNPMRSHSGAPLLVAERQGLPPSSYSAGRSIRSSQHFEQGAESFGLLTAPSTRVLRAAAPFVSAAASAVLGAVPAHRRSQVASSASRAYSARASVAAAGDTSRASFGVMQADARHEFEQAYSDRFGQDSALDSSSGAAAEPQSAARVSALKRPSLPARPHTIANCGGALVEEVSASGIAKEPATAQAAGGHHKIVLLSLEQAAVDGIDPRKSAQATDCGHVVPISTLAEAPPEAMLAPSLPPSASAGRVGGQNQAALLFTGGRVAATSNSGHYMPVAPRKRQTDRPSDRHKLAQLPRPAAESSAHTAARHAAIALPRPIPAPPEAVSSVSEKLRVSESSSAPSPSSSLPWVHRHGPKLPAPPPPPPPSRFLPTPIPELALAASPQPAPSLPLPDKV